MGAYQKFSAPPQNEARAPTPPKAPKTPNPADCPAESSLAALAALGGAGDETQIGPVEVERAAIVEHDGGIPQIWVEGFAGLNPDRVPGDVPSRRWQRFVDDVGLFLDGPFCAVATALGWGPLDLFGCDGTRPFARIDRAGLVWLLAGDKLIALTADTATVETRTGARQTYRRKPNEPGRVLAWDL
jgi:hypothetical protein